jgi:hypothetical protein
MGPSLIFSLVIGWSGIAALRRVSPDRMFGRTSMAYRARSPSSAAALRTYDAATSKWAIWWNDGRTPHILDVPVIGQFVDDIGTFMATDTFNGKPIVVRFIWSDVSGQTPRWEQAFSPDDGQSWEVNWMMDFRRAQT